MKTKMYPYESFYCYENYFPPMLIYRIADIYA